MTASSPCVNICDIDPVSGLCIGCLRTIDEIIAWGSLSEMQRQAIMDRLPERVQGKKAP